MTSANTAWCFLLLASGLEVVWASTMKASAGLSDHRLTAVTVVAAVASFILLGLSLRTLPVGTAYVVWTGIGAVGVVIVGVVRFDEPSSLLRLACIALIVLGVVGLKLGSESS